ncbi:MurR/RpiR family transcriptional regulator [Microbacterium sp. XT11]|uniref:MurR/RpiR family transcriptional regulator n=1 Tax=Microbacterium sp. XT11 TaxID=367477 RepID=UPI00082DAE41|nr:MurR/RpiR family transcriptional regulator [Microbacterium sp. XT11]
MEQRDAIALVRESLPGLTASERRIAEEILDDPTGVAGLAITDLAVRCETSVSTVARFAQSLGYSGYRELRAEISRSVTLAQAQRERFGLETTAIDPHDAVSTVAAKIGAQQVDAIERTARMVDADAVDRVAAAIVSARRIELLGQGASALTAQDLQQKLVRIGLAASHASDPHLALTMASLCTEEDVVIAFSHSGATPETIRTATVAHDAGALTVAVTNEPAAPLLDAVDVVLLTHADESPFRMAAMSSRIAQLALIDILFVRIVQRAGGSVSTPLHLTHDAIARR